MIKESDLRNYILERVNANNQHLELTKGTKNHEPEWYDGANTALREMWSDFELEEE